MKMTLLTTLTALALLTACEKSAQDPHAGGPPPPQPVTLAAVEEKPLVEWGEFAGRIDAIESVDLRPRVSGLLTEVRFQSGALVKEGDVLFVIDPRPFQAVVDKAKGEEKRAEAQAKSAKKEFDRAVHRIILP